jgi:integrase/recombinase XerD
VSTEQHVREQVERFEAFLRTEKRTEATVASYTRSLRLCLEFIGKPYTGLQKADMQAWKAHLAEKYCENSMAPQIAAVNKYLESVAERPDLKLRQVKKVTKDIVCLTADEVKAILTEAKRPRVGNGQYTCNVDYSKRDYAAICLAYYGGLRADEIVNLRISGLDLDRKRVRVFGGKGKDYSNVNLSDEAVGAIREYLESGRPEPAVGSEDHLLLTNAGYPMSRKDLWMMVKKTAFRAGIEKNVYPHIFRHSMITHMAEKGLSAPFIQAQSRHKKLETMQRYIHLSHQTVRDAYDRVFEEPEGQVRVPESDVADDTLPEPEPFGALSLNERILLKYLDGEITDDRFDRLLHLLDRKMELNLKGDRKPMPGYL